MENKIEYAYHDYVEKFKWLRYDEQELNGKWIDKIDHMSGYPIYEPLTIEEFIDKVLVDDDFYEKWALDAAQQMTLEERYRKHMWSVSSREWIKVHYKEPKSHQYYNKIGFPKRILIENQ